LLATCEHGRWRLIAFDPYARLKGISDEDSPKGSGPVLDFLRELRGLSSSTVLYVAHTGHEGTKQRGSSDFESYCASKLTLVDESGRRTLTADHREAEAAGPFELSFRFDGQTRTLRIDADGDELARRASTSRSIRARLETTSSLRWARVDRRFLELVKKLRPEGGSDSPEPPGTTLLRTEAGKWFSGGPL
jgi:hypothetical protein